MLNQLRIYKFLLKILEFCCSRKQNQSIMPAITKSKIIVFLFAFGGVFLSLKNEVINKENPFLFLFLFFLFLGVLKALVQASFRANKATKIVQ